MWIFFLALISGIHSQIAFQQQGDQNILHPYYEPEAFGLMGRPSYYPSEPTYELPFYYDGPSYYDFDGLESIGPIVYGFEPNLIDGFDYETNSFFEDSKLLIADSPRVVSSAPIQSTIIVAQNHDDSLLLDNDTVFINDGNSDPQNEFQIQTEENLEPEAKLEDKMPSESLNAESKPIDDVPKLPVHRNMDIVPLMSNTEPSSQPERIVLSVPKDMKVRVVTSSSDATNNDAISSEKLIVQIPDNLQVKVVPEEKKLNAVILSKK